MQHLPPPGRKSVNVARLSIFCLVCCTIAGLAISCSSKPEFTVTFCPSSSEQPCASSQDTFKVGDHIQVQLTAAHSFEATEITGYIYRLGESDSIELGDKTLAVSPGDAYVIQSLPFHEFGTEAMGSFSVVFVDEKEQLLARKALTIVDK